MEEEIKECVQHCYVPGVIVEVFILIGVLFVVGFIAGKLASSSERRFLDKIRRGREDE